MRLENTLTFSEKMAYISDIYEDSFYEGTKILLSEKKYGYITTISKFLVVYSTILISTISSRDNTKLIKALEIISIDLSQRYKQASANAAYSALKNHLLGLIKSNHIQWGPISKELQSFCARGIKPEIHTLLKKKSIPRSIRIEFKHVTPKEVFLDETLNLCCTPAIAKSLKHYIHSYKQKYAQKIRSQAILILKQLHSANNDWHLHRFVIQSELVKYRATLLDTRSRNTAINLFFIVKKIFQTLLDQGLLPPGLDLPDNLKAPRSNDDIRSKNPIMSNIDLYSRKNIEKYKDTPVFLESLQQEIHANLKILTDRAKEIVWEGYQKFLSGQCIIDNYNNFKKSQNIDVESTPNSFNNPQPAWTMKHIIDIDTARKLSFFDENYELYLSTQASKKLDYSISPTHIEYLGLTVSVASAMQAIIVDEIGINPFSLYNILISSDGLGREFVQVTSEGSVRLRSLKRRAKRSQIRKAQGTIVNLCDVVKHDIDAAVCLKMALEMSARARSTSNMQNLWLCRTVHGLNQLSDSTFQYHFNKLREALPSDNTALQDATLKKIRVSRGVLIFIESRGDALKVSSYLGNQVETSLNRYIPAYLSELIYRMKIRKFQNILLYMSIHSDDSPSESLGVSSETFNLKLKSAFENQDMGGVLYDKLVNPDINITKTEALYFCVSKTNIELALRYIKSGEDLVLKENCIAAISTISEGTIIMKKMLRDSQLALEKQEKEI